MTDGEDQYNLKDWTPPWLDNGDCLMEIIKAAQGIDNPISWQVICHLLVNQLQIDLKIAREINFMFNDDINDEALPYQWNAENKKESLQKIWKKIESQLDSYNFNEDEEDE